jgi:hypothetical protein
MTYEQLLKSYGTLSKAAQDLGLSKQTVHYWSKAKRIPDRWQIVIAQKTGLTVDRHVKRRAAAYATVLQGVNGQEAAAVK